MEIALVTEGTYPHSFGGVSVWADQLVQGLPQHDFRIVALVSTGREPVVWELPKNVCALDLVPLWGHQAGADRIPRRSRSWFRSLFKQLLDSLLDTTDEQAAQRSFEEALQGLFHYAQLEDLGAAMRSEEPVKLLCTAWQRLWPAQDSKRHIVSDSSHVDDPTVPGEPPTVRDALAAVELLEHALRPLSKPVVHSDVVHCVTNGLAVLVGLAAKWSFGTPLIVTEHGIYLRERYLEMKRSPYRWPVKALNMAFSRRLCSLAYRAADLVAPGNQYNARWETRLGADPKNIQTVYNGVDPAAFPLAGAEPETPTLSWAGRIDPIKDLETLIRAFGMVRQEIPGAKLRIFGGTPKGGQAYAQKCKDLAADLGIADVVAFEGRVDEIRDAYAAGNVVVLSSISEGFPYTLIEAMTSGRATVSTDVGGVSEAVADTGLVVPPKDPKSMAQACVSLLNDPEQRAVFGEAARKRALELFTVDKAIGTFHDIYTGLRERADTEVAKGTRIGRRRSEAEIA
ncbi:DUF3492 domain-containing protein [Pseudonocardiaceae bacterium YIM PH 21723]|nr:DUF3492 domain-containing protein [Pseudonocardiaceae bacterium YIM PH 21723]